MSDWQNTIQTGDCFDVLGELPESSVHMCMTSPPYYGLRDYGVDGQIGLEETLDEYIDRLVRVGDDLRRVLRDGGSWWLNLGDSYDTDGDILGLGEKQKSFVPHRVAIELQRNGWIARNDVDWVKPNPMPSSVKDRLNTTTEQVFHLTPKSDYWYDLDAIREPHQENTKARAERGLDSGHKLEDSAPGQSTHSIHKPADEQGGLHPAGKNPGDVFEVTTKPFPDAHFAVYPPEICEKPIKATCPPKVCVSCGAPYEREVEREVELEDGRNVVGLGEKTGGDRMDNHGDGGSTLHHTVKRHTKGWQQTCDCDTDATESGICLDPFAGAGTTCLKAKELGRRFVGIELNPEYADMARARVGLSPEDPARVRSDDAQQGLEAFVDGGGSDE